MKKECLVFVCILIIGILPISMVSANWFGDVWNKITGFDVEEICTDSDGGVDYYVKGTKTNSSGSISDFCVNANTQIIEFSCDSDGDLTPYTCPNGCSNGACIEEEECTDSDGGIDYYVKGTKTNSSGSISDFCIWDNTGIMEQRCGTEELNEWGGIPPYTCPNGCSNGACIEESDQPPPTSGGGGGGGGGTLITTSTQTTTTTYTTTTQGSGGGKGFTINIQESKVIGEGGVEAISQAELSESEGIVYVNHSSGNKKQIKITPDEVVETTKQETNTETIKEVRIIEYKEFIVYEISFEKPVKILAFIKVDMKIKPKINIETGDILDIGKPWWSFLATGD